MSTSDGVYKLMRYHETYFHNKGCVLKSEDFINAALHLLFCPHVLKSQENISHNPEVYAFSLLYSCNKC